MFLNPDIPTAILVVDAQNGFVHERYGELPAPDGPAALPHIAGLIDGHRAAAPDVIVAACGDAHTDTCPEFTDNGGIWPRHCVWGTPGAELVDEVAERVTTGWFFRKGATDDDIQYSFAKGRDENGRGPAGRLRDHGVKRVVVMGYVTNVCVLATALDFLAEGFEVVVHAPGCVAIPGNPDVGLPSGEEALQQMRDAGATVTSAVDYEPVVGAAA